MADAPLLNALIVAHGQPSDPAPAEAALAALAARVQAHLPARSVGSATLAAPGALETALNRLAPGGAVYPFFMADGIFVRDVAENPDNRLFVRTLMGLAEGFGLETVAECVENAEVAKILTEEGANYLQGWHFGKPDVAPHWRIAPQGLMRRRAAE